MDLPVDRIEVYRDPAYSPRKGWNGTSGGHGMADEGGWGEAGWHQTTRL